MVIDAERQLPYNFHILTYLTCNKHLTLAFLIYLMSQPFLYCVFIRLSFYHNQEPSLSDGRYQK